VLFPCGFFDFVKNFINTEPVLTCSILFKFKSKIPDFERGEDEDFTPPQAEFKFESDAETE